VVYNTLTILSRFAQHLDFLVNIEASGHFPIEVFVTAFQVVLNLVRANLPSGG